MASTYQVALEFIPKSVIDDYASIECITFGDILLQAMCINGGCTVFKPSKKYAGHYIIGWLLENGDEYTDIISYETIKKYLKGKSLTLTMDVHTRK